MYTCPVCGGVLNSGASLSTGSTAIHTCNKISFVIVMLDPHIIFAKCGEYV